MYYHSIFYLDMTSQNDAKFYADPDEATYWQRVKKTWNMLDVTCALASTTDVEKAKKFVQQASKNSRYLLAFLIESCM